MRRMRRLLLLPIAVVARGNPRASVVATVRITKRPGRVNHGDDASVTVIVSPKARCTIGVYYSTTRSRARGLGAKRGGTITWTWTVGSNTNPGAWPVKIDCGKSGKAATTVTVPVSVRLVAFVAV